MKPITACWRNCAASGARRSRIGPRGVASRAPPSGRVSAEHVVNVLGRLHAPERPANAHTALRALTPPLADTARYDRLRRVEADHA